MFMGDAVNNFAKGMLDQAIRLKDADQYRINADGSVDSTFP